MCVQVNSRGQIDRILHKYIQTRSDFSSDSRGLQGSAASLVYHTSQVIVSLLLVRYAVHARPAA